MAAPCEPIARSDDTTSDLRYGRRNASSRTNVRQFVRRSFVASPPAVTGF